MKRWVWLSLVLILPVAVWLWLMSPVEQHLRGQAFGTHYRITYLDGLDASPATVQQAIDAELARIDAMASTWREDSELMRYNRAADAESFELSPELAGLIADAQAIEELTGSAFSPRPEGRDLDLSGIAKGYAVDRVIDLLQHDFGVTNALVDIGGEVRAIGDGPEGDGWRVGVYLPDEMPSLAVPVLSLHNAAVATSGAYFRGEHIIDPLTGEPVDHEVVSVTVLDADCARADALATALYVMGEERGLAWAQVHAVHAIFVLKDGTQREHKPE